MLTNLFLPAAAYLLEVGLDENLPHDHVAFVAEATDHSHLDEIVSAIRDNGSPHLVTGLVAKKPPDVQLMLPKLHSPVPSPSSFQTFPVGLLLGRSCCCRRCLCRHCPHLLLNRLYSQCKSYVVWQDNSPKQLLFLLKFHLKEASSESTNVGRAFRMHIQLESSTVVKSSIKRVVRK